jgi:hypothetical protein
MPEREITLRLHEGSLERLLAGELVCRVWLNEEEPGVFRLCASTYDSDDGPGAVSARALLHWLCSGDRERDGIAAPPMPDLTEDEAEMLGRWEALMESLPAVGFGDATAAQIGEQALKP